MTTAAQRLIHLTARAEPRNVVDFLASHGAQYTARFQENMFFTMPDGSRIAYTRSTAVLRSMPAEEE